MTSIKNHRIITTGVFVILVAAYLSGCITPDSAESNKAHLVIGTADPFFGFHPWIQSYDVSTLSINHNIFNTLVSLDNYFRIQPELAESWSNPDNLTWRFKIRHNIQFHNGYNLTIDDIKYSIDLILNNDTSVFKDLLTNVKEIKIQDNQTIDIITEKPCPILLNKLADIFIVSKKYHEEDNGKNPVGTGAYEYVNYTDDEELILESYDNYWHGQPDFTQVTFKLIKDSKSRKDALINHDIDIAESLSNMYYQNLSNTPGIILKMVTPPTVNYLGFDFREYNSSSFKEEKNPLADIRVRKALYHAINPEQIIEETCSDSLFATPATQFIPPLIFGYNPNISRLPYDLQRSRQLLNESGYNNGFDLIMDCPQEYYEHKEMCEVIHEQLSKIINITLNEIPLTKFFEKIITRNTSFYIIGWLSATGDGGEIFDYLIRSPDKESGIGTYNIGYYSNPNVDRIGEVISYTMSTKERLQLMQQGFQIAMDDIACIPLLSSKLIYGIADHINWDPNPGMLLNVEDMKLKK
jgi:peptide/nickel transport system substrate-binding protein